jgi:hypothetical protein
MLLAKLISIILTLLAALAQFALDYKWKDRRTKAFSRIRAGLFFLYTVSAFVSIILVVVDDQQSSKLISGLVEIRDSLSNQASKAAQREQAAISSSDRVTVELADLKRALLPFQQLASKKFPTDPPDLALSKLISLVSALQQRTSQLEQSTAEIATQDVFRPVAGQLKNQVIVNLRNLKSHFGARLQQVDIFCVVGNRPRQLLAQEMDECLKGSGLSAKPVGFGFMSGAPPPVQITLHPDDWDIAESLANVLASIVKTQFSGLKDPKQPKGSITIAVAGTPVFASDGSVTIH